MPAPAANPEFPRAFGDYLLLAQLGEGGMGVVYQAIHQPTGRACALKLVRRDVRLEGSDPERRFASRQQRLAVEIEAAARLDHQNIVRVHHAGQHEGVWFLEMQLVEGGNLAERLQNGALTPREAAALLLRLARAVQEAHGHGVIHCDLKPANVLLDADDEPRLADFGIASLLDRKSDLQRTLAGLGTPAYMAPERASGEERHATIAADTYSLGAILYECLVGRPAFTAETVPALLHKVATESPPPLPAQIPGPGAKPVPLPRDLAILTHRAMAREPGQRFASAGEFADELERFLKHEPIHSREVSLPERLWLWSRRHPRAALATATALAASLVAVVTILVLWRTAETVSADLRRERGLLRQTVVQDTLRLADGDVAEGRKSAAFQRVAQTELTLKDAPGLTEWLAERLANDTFPIEVLNLSFPGEVTAHFDRLHRRIVSCGVGGYWLHEQRSGKLLLHLPTLTPQQNTEEDQGLDFWESPDGTRVLGHERGSVYALWNVEHLAQPVLVWTNDPGRPVTVSPDRQFFVTGDTNGSVTLGCLGRDTSALNSFATGTALPQSYLRQLPALPAKAASFALSTGAAVIAAALPDGRLFTLRPGSNTWARLDTWRTNLAAFALSPDGQYALATTDRECAGWALGRGLARFAFTNAATIWGLAISPSDALFAIGDQDRQLTLRSLTNGTPVGKSIEFVGTPTPVDFTSTGREILVGSWAGEAAIVRVSPREVITTARHVHEVVSVDYFEEERLLLSSTDGSIRLWQLALPAQAQQVSTNLKPFSTVTVLPSGWPVREGAAPGLHGSANSRINPTASLLGFDTNQALFALGRAGESLQPVKLGQFPKAASHAFAPLPERTLFLADTNGTIWRHRLEGGGAPEELLRLDPPVSRLQVSDRGDALLALSTSNLVSVAITGRTAQVRLQVPFPGATKPVFSPVGDFAAASVWQGTLLVVAPREGRQLWNSDKHIGPIPGIAFSPDGRRLATASPDGSVCIWDSASGQQLIPPFTKLTEPTDLCWDRAGERLFIGGLDAGVVLDARKGIELGRFGPSPGYNAVALSPDGLRMALSGSKGTVSVWSTSGRNRLQTWDMSQPWESTARLAWSADGSELLTWNPDGLVRSTRMPPPIPSAVLPAFLEWITGQTLNAAGATIDLPPAARAERLTRLRAAAARGDLAPDYARHLPPTP